MEMEREAGLDPLLWIAFAGRLVKTFKIGTDVYFYPKGYQEQVNGIVDFSRIPSSIPSQTLCKVLGIDYLANLVTDEVYVKIKLIPVPNFFDEGDDGGHNVKKVESFVKTLTLSDTRGRELPVPKGCAETIFPKDVQSINVKDVHGRILNFGYRERSKRHYLTTGWNIFFENKSLAVGDSIVFAIDNNDEIRVGIRRKKRPDEYGDDWNEKKVSPESFIQSLNLAIRGDQAFEVIYYPRLNAPAFCVNASRVSKSLDISLSVSLRCTIELENEKSSRTNWVNGTITWIQNQWKSSPWKSFKVEWDNHHLDIHKVEFVSPWMIELLELSDSPSRKKQRVDLLTPPPPPPPPPPQQIVSGDIQQDMQGAMQDPFGGSSSSSLSMANFYNFDDYSTTGFPEFNFDPGCVSIAGGFRQGMQGAMQDQYESLSSSSYVANFYSGGSDGKEKDKDEEGNDDGKGDANEGNKK